MRSVKATSALSSPPQETDINACLHGVKSSSNLCKRFDSSGSGSVQKKESFSYLSGSNYEIAAQAENCWSRQIKFLGLFDSIKLRLFSAKKKLFKGGHRSKMLKI